MLEERLEQALRLAIDPPGGLNTAALRDLIRDEENAQWDIATTAEYLGISAHTLRYYERAGLVKVGRDASGLSALRCCGCTAFGFYYPNAGLWNVDCPTPALHLLG